MTMKENDTTVLDLMMKTMPDPIPFNRHGGSSRNNTITTRSFPVTTNMSQYVTTNMSQYVCSSRGFNQKKASTTTSRNDFFFYKEHHDEEDPSNVVDLIISIFLPSKRSSLSHTSKILVPAPQDWRNRYAVDATAVDEAAVAGVSGGAASYKHDSVGRYMLSLALPTNPFPLLSPVPPSFPPAAVGAGVTSTAAAPNPREGTLSYESNSAGSGLLSIDATDFHDVESTFSPTNLFLSQLSPVPPSCTATHKHGQWYDRYRELVEYVKEFGHTTVPHRWSRNPKLAQWVKRQRYQYKLKHRQQQEEGGESGGQRSGGGNMQSVSSLTDEREDLLNRIGFIWSLRKELWDENFMELVDYAKAHGHCNVPSKYPPNRTLSVWVRCQRRQYKLYMLMKEKNEKNNNQMDVVVSEDDWYKDVYATLTTTTTNRTIERTNITEERIEKLLSIGFVFNPRNMKI